MTMKLTVAGHKKAPLSLPAVFVRLLAIFVSIFRTERREVGRR